MADGEAFALDHVLAGRSHIEQQVHEMVVEQVHFVDIEKAAIGAGEQARLEALLALGEGAFEIQRADHTVFGRAERQVDDRRRDLFGDLGFLAVADAAQSCGRRRQAAIGTAADDFDFGQQGRQGPDRG